MKILGTALGDYADLASGGAAVLGIVIGGQYLHFLCGVEISRSDTEGCIGAGPDSYGAIEKDSVTLATRAVDIEVTHSQAKIVAVQQPAHDARLCQCQEQRVTSI